jgi:hypothetical protein
MDKYLPHSTLADMNATHLDIERVRIAAQQRADELIRLAINLEMISYCAPWNPHIDTIDKAAATLRQLAEGK